MPAVGLDQDEEGEYLSILPEVWTRVTAWFQLGNQQSMSGVRDPNT